MVSPLLYLVIGISAGAVAAGLFVLIGRRKNSGIEAELVKRLEMLDRAQERAERQRRRV